MPNPTRKSLWEAFSSGQFGGEYQYGTPFEQESDYGARTGAFWEQVIGPSLGIGTEDLATAAFDPTEMQRAEEKFRTSIGDPYTGGGTDPFAWERLSRYETASEAQELLEGELYGSQGSIGGQTGADYGTGLLKSKETYRTGLTGKREGITYGDLMSDVAQQSGTSGMVLRSGSGVAQAENILAETYKGAKTLGGEYMLEKEEVQTTLQKNLSGALTTYMDTLEEEKKIWYDDILDTIRGSRTQEDPYTSTAEFEEGFTPLPEWEQGLTYDEEEYTTREGGACGIGELYSEVVGQCLSYENYEEQESKILRDIKLNYEAQPSQDITGIDFPGEVPSIGMPEEDVSQTPTFTSNFRTRRPRSPFGRGRRRRGRRAF